MYKRQVGDVVVLHKDHLHAALHVRVAVHPLRDLVQILDDPLGAVVAGRGLCAEEEDGRIEIGEPPVLEGEVDVQDGERVEELALILCLLYTSPSPRD